MEKEKVLVELKVDLDFSYKEMDRPGIDEKGLMYYMGRSDGIKLAIRLLESPVDLIF